VKESFEDRYAMSTHRVIIACLVSIVLAIGACGGDDEPSGAKTTTGDRKTSTGPTRAEYLARGDALCAEVQTEAADLARRAQELKAKSKKLPEAKVLEEAAGLWADQIRLIDEFLARLQALGAPPADEEKVEQFVASIEEGLAIAREIHSTLEQGNEASPSLLVQYSGVVSKGNTLAQAYGFDVCGRTQ
jgi:hypothetical protein